MDDIPRKPKVTQADVLAAADLLSERGERITMRAIRKELGDTGSMGTIHAGYSVWLATHGQPSAARPIGDVAFWADEVTRLTKELRHAAAELVKATGRPS